MSARWLAALLGVLACVTAAAGCGSSAKPPASPPVHLSVDAPRDRVTTLAGEVFVRGTVSPPAATVEVAGQPVAVRQGGFTAHVPIRPGANVIDVLAGAPHVTGAMTALRVYRQIAVGVPDLTGASPDRAVAELNSRSLTARVIDVGGFFQSLIPGSNQVCQTIPAAGRLLAPGSQVQLQVAKFC